MVVRDDARRVSSTWLLAGLVVAGVLAQGLLAEAVAGSVRARAAFTVFAGIFVQAVPFLVLGVVLSGLVAAFVSPRVLGKILPRNETAAIGVAGLAGAAVPGCECGVVPVARRLTDQGAPGAVALAFMLSAPAINPMVLIATAVAFPGEPGMVAARFAGSLATALLMGLLWSRLGQPGWMTPAPAHPHHTAGRTRWETFTEAARHDLVQAAAFLVVGAAAAALLHVAVPPDWYAHLAGQLALAVLVLAVLAVLLALCSEADAFVAASMSALPLLPRLVFLVVGPAVDVKLFAMQAGTFGRAFAIRFAPLTFAVAVVCGTVAGLVFLGGAR
ncbi:permease [Nocardia jiangsuensis]|uniref:Permease n=1 Tax=Nocardia jiangsuensis TaxID=1691563 RepID=A0ABV8DZW0_9NOCA